MNRISIQFALLFLISYSVIFILFAFDVVSGSFLKASLYAGGLNGINAALTVYAYNKGHNNTTKNFILFIFGGMIIRMFLILLLFLILVKYFYVDKALFVFTFLVLYFITLILEINYYRLKTLRKKA